MLLPFIGVRILSITTHLAHGLSQNQSDVVEALVVPVPLHMFREEVRQQVLEEGALVRSLPFIKSAMDVKGETRSDNVYFDDILVGYIYVVETLAARSLLIGRPRILRINREHRLL